MKAILMTQTGSSETLALRDIPEPEITADTHVKIKLHAAGVNPIDTKLRRGGVFYPNALPAVLGCDGAGEIVALGNAVTQFAVGDKVWYCHGGLGKEQGNYAEFNVLDQRWLTAMPQTSSFTEAAAGPLVLITAWGALYARGGLQAGQTVLIHAGAGGVGHVAIQLAKLKGATVIATVSSVAKAEFVQQLGVDAVINYKQDDFVKQVMQITEGQGADLVFDTVGADVFQRSIAATAHFGRIVTLLDPGQLDLSEVRMRNLLIGFELMLTPILKGLNAAREQHVAILRQCAEKIDRGELRLKITETLPLAQARQAHELLETGHMLGKLVLRI